MTSKLIFFLLWFLLCACSAVPLRNDQSYKSSHPVLSVCIAANCRSYYVDRSKRKGREKYSNDQSSDEDKQQALRQENQTPKEGE